MNDTNSRRIRNDGLSAAQKLLKLGMIQVSWTGRCEADRATTGTYDVPAGTTAAMYGLVFDNTHSKQWSKTVTFVLMTYPFECPAEIRPSSTLLTGRSATNFEKAILEYQWQNKGVDACK